LVRLKEQEIAKIKDIISNIFEDATIYLFGSRLDMSKKGGDIDLFIVSKNNSLELKLEALSRLKRALHKPVDIVLHKDFSKAIEQEALNGVVL